MTPKIKSLVSAIFAAGAGFLSQISALPPSLQDTFVQKLQAVFPVSMRPEIASLCGLVSSVALIYAIRQASHSGPATKPVTDTQTGVALPVSQSVKTQPIAP